MPKNILFIENSLLPSRGGIEKVTDILSQAFQKDGNYCFYAYWAVNNPQYNESSKLHMNFKDSTQQFKQKFKSFIIEKNIEIIINQGLCQRKLLLCLEQTKKQTEIQIINCLHNTPNYLHYIQSPSSFKIRAILWVKSLLMGGNVYIKEQQKLYQLSDYYVLLSESFIPQAENEFQLRDIQKLKFIPNPIPTFSTTLSQNSLIKEKTILIVARFDENQKNLKSALRIWKKVSEKAVDWRLQIIGYGDSEAEYHDYIKELAIQNVFIEGKKENPAEFYQKASIFMMTSRYEGLALTLIEALQHKCIPMAFNTFTAVNDIILDKINGYTIPPFDEELYAQEMIGLTEDSKLLNELRQNSNLTLDKFKESDVKEQWYKLIKK